MARLLPVLSLVFLAGAFAASAMEESPSSEEAILQSDSCSPPKPTFLDSVSRRARAAFNQIVNDPKLTGDQRLEAFRKWAEPLGAHVEAALQEWLSAVDEKVLERNDGEVEVIVMVKDVLKQIREIEQNDDLPRKEQKKQIANVLKEAPSNIAKIVDRVRRGAVCK